MGKYFYSGVDNLIEMILQKFSKIQNKIHRKLPAYHKSFEIMGYNGYYMQFWGIKADICNQLSLYRLLLFLLRIEKIGVGNFWQLGPFFGKGWPYFEWGEEYEVNYRRQWV